MTNPTGGRRVAKSIAELTTLDAEQQFIYATEILGNDVEEGEVNGLLYLAESGKGPNAAIRAVLALGGARTYASQVLPKLVELLKRRPTTDKFVRELIASIGKLPGALEYLPLLSEYYHSSEWTTQTRGVVGCAIAEIVSSPTSNVTTDTAKAIVGDLLTGESPHSAILRYLVERPAHDSVTVAALQAMLKHPSTNFKAAVDLVRAASRCRHSETIRAAAFAALMHFRGEAK